MKIEQPILLASERIGLINSDLLSDGWRLRWFTGIKGRVEGLGYRV